jgi:cupin fold WbuC family metalloprotein
MNRQELTDALVCNGFSRAYSSHRKRHPILLHEQGAYFNEVFNFVCRDSYMQPHLHPGQEKIEVIQVLRGVVAVLFFGDNGEVTRCTQLEPEGCDKIEVPAFTWHTYVMMSDEVITYESMNGIYDPETWKKYASWAPAEHSVGTEGYLETLRIAIASN